MHTRGHIVHGPAGASTPSVRQVDEVGTSVGAGSVPRTRSPKLDVTPHGGAAQRNEDAFQVPRIAVMDPVRPGLLVASECRRDEHDPCRSAAR